MQACWKTSWPWRCCLVAGCTVAKGSLTSVWNIGSFGIEQRAELRRIDLLLHEAADVLQALHVDEVVEAEVAVLRVREDGAARRLHELAHAALVEEPEGEDRVHEPLRLAPEEQLARVANPPGRTG